MHSYDNWKQQVDWLADAKKKTYAEGKLCMCTAETREDEITNEPSGIIDDIIPITHCA